MKGLKDDADGAAAEAGKPVFVEPAQVFAGDHDGAGIGPLQPGHHHEQRRLAGARRAEQADRLAAAYIEADVAQDMDAGGAAAERQVDAAEHDGVAGGRMARNVVHASEPTGDPRRRVVPAHMGRGALFVQIAAICSVALAAATVTPAARSADRRSISSRSAIR